jgi:hypothetical protein
MKTFKSIFYLALSCVIFYNCNSWYDKIFSWEVMRPGYDGSTPWLNFYKISMIIPVWFLILSFINIVKSQSVAGEVIGGIIAGTPSECDDEHKHIERVRQYRNSKISLMSNETAAKELKSTMLLDGVESLGGKHSKRAAEYVNSKLSMMDNESALKWIKEK